MKAILVIEMPKFFTLLDCFIIVIGGGIWILNIWIREMTGKDIAMDIFERWNIK